MPRTKMKLRNPGNLMFFFFLCFVSSIHVVESKKIFPETNNSALEEAKLSYKEVCPEQCPKCSEHMNCPTGVPRIWDICGCCMGCAKQQGEECGLLYPCDGGLVCVNGLCHAKNATDCKVGSSIHKDGETWKPDCQTICECQNGIFGCTDVCRPDKLTSECKFGRKLVVESECCSRWVCQDKLPSCSNTTTDWSECSCSKPTVSHQWTNHNSKCQWVVHQRQCNNLSNCSSKITPAKKAATQLDTIEKAKKFCEASLYHRLEFIEEDNCKSSRMLHTRSCLSNCHLADGTKFCCTPNEFASRNIHFICKNGQTVLRTFPVIVACACQIC